ncbi:MAG: cytidine deaminase [candidate division Zixibacteria bacterium]|nr:cytidine deaminase [candidate division Zixibacteria bacterium]
MSNNKSRIKDKELILEAKKAMKLAYAPYSNFKVGAALLSRNGEVFTGANLENSSFGLTVCAERVALYRALSSGEKNYIKIAIVALAEKPITPCGLCRQALFEFSPDLKVICSNMKGKVKKYTLKQLLPHPFNYDKRKGKGK